MLVFIRCVKCDLKIFVTKGKGLILKIKTPLDHVKELAVKGGAQVIQIWDQTENKQHNKEQ